MSTLVIVLVKSEGLRNPLKVRENSQFSFNLGNKFLIKTTDDILPIIKKELKPQNFALALSLRKVWMIYPGEIESFDLMDPNLKNKVDLKVKNLKLNEEDVKSALGQVKLLRSMAV